VNANNVRQQWADRSGEYSPAYYAYYGPDETSELIRASLARILDRDASILELGCSSGRHLAHLHEDGFDSLAGVDINDEAFDVMAEAYPDLAEAGTFYVDAIEDVVAEFDDDRFDAVYSAETLQNIHPDDEWVFDELARITDEVFVTAEIEEPVEDAEPAEDADPATDVDSATDTDDGHGDANVNYVTDELPLYYRDWERVFTERGFEQVDVGETRRDTVRTFRTTTA
jgi:SAM-dependent methyltransferase